MYNVQYPSKVNRYSDISLRHFP